MIEEIKTYGRGKYIPKYVKEKVYARADNHCEKCGTGLRNPATTLMVWSGQDYGCFFYIGEPSKKPTARTVKLLCYDCYKEYKRKVEERKHKAKANTSTKKPAKNSVKRPRTPCPKSVKEALWIKYFKNNINGKCYVCGTPITLFNFEVGHNKPFSKGGEWNINNLRPLCRSCNRSMGTMTVEKYKKKSGL